MANLEIHTWFSRVAPGAELTGLPQADNISDEEIGRILRYPDFLIFDIDPYIYSGKEARGAEPELNPEGFARTGEVARWLKEVFDSLSLSSFVKTSGRTGLHVYVPIVRQFDYHTVRSASQTIARFLVKRHPGEVTTEWAVEKRAGKVFLDYNQNVYGKTLASVYSPRPTPEATISTPLTWEEVGKVYPTDFTMLTVPVRLAQIGDLWSDILQARSNLQKLLETGA
jgi:bifunctional non-homologous end joining protein LigD